MTLTIKITITRMGKMRMSNNDDDNEEDKEPSLLNISSFPEIMLYFVCVNGFPVPPDCELSTGSSLLRDPCCAY